jgi:uncharacterized protein YktA (UPF0223 family)
MYNQQQNVSQLKEYRLLKKFIPKKKKHQNKKIYNQQQNVPQLKEYRLLKKFIPKMTRFLI